VRELLADFRSYLPCASHRLPRRLTPGSAAEQRGWRLLLAPVARAPGDSELAPCREHQASGALMAAELANLAVD
jgi:hypothetical protein